MIHVKLATEVNKEEVYSTMMAGFSDYMVDIKMDEETFWHHFFKVEGNLLECSHVAYLDDQPVGIVFGGFRTDESVKTLRCGALAVTPEGRGKGVATALMDAHRTVALTHGCKQIFLEVIIGNEPAIQLYKKLGYEITNNIKYWQLDSSGMDQMITEKMEEKQSGSLDYVIKAIDFAEAEALSFEGPRHLPWQASFPYMKNADCVYEGIFVKDELAGIAIWYKHKLMYIFVKQAYRNHDLGRALIVNKIQNEDWKSMVLFHSNNHEIQSYAKKIGMKLDKLGQFEMYQWIG